MQKLERINLQRGTSPCKSGLMTRFWGMYNFPLAIQVDPTVYLARSLSLNELNTNTSDKCYSKVVFLFILAFRRAQQNQRTQGHSPKLKDGIAFNIGLIL